MDRDMMLAARELQIAGKYAEALGKYEAVIGRDASNAVAYEGAAECLNMLRRFDEALERATKATQLDGQSVKAHAVLAYIHLSRNDLQSATREAGAAFQANPNAEEALQSYGTVLLYQRRLEEGIALLEKALAINPRSIFIRRNLAFAYYQNKDVANFLRQKKAIFSLRPSVPAAFELVLAYMARYVAAVAIGICLIMQVASVWRVKALLLVPLAYIGYVLWTAWPDLKRREWSAAKGALILVVLIGIPAVYILVR